MSSTRQDREQHVLSHLTWHSCNSSCDKQTERNEIHRFRPFKDADFYPLISLESWFDRFKTGVLCSYSDVYTYSEETSTVWWRERYHEIIMLSYRLFSSCFSRDYGERSPTVNDEWITRELMNIDLRHIDVSLEILFCTLTNVGKLVEKTCQSWRFYSVLTVILKQTSWHQNHDLLSSETRLGSFWSDLDSVSFSWSIRHDDENNFYLRLPVL